jgi:hypothetical protein
MSTSPEDRIVNVLSRWLAGHVDNRELRRAIEESEPRRLAPAHAEAVEELLAKLEESGPQRRGDVEKVVRETLEALAIG